MPELKKKDWLECLQSESPDELGLQLAIRAFELHRIKWKVTGQQLEIAF